MGTYLVGVLTGAASIFKPEGARAAASNRLSIGTGRRPHAVREEIREET